MWLEGGTLSDSLQMSFKCQIILFAFEVWDQ